MAGFFGLFDYNKPGPGVRKDEPEKKGAARFFSILGKRIWKIISLNFLYVLFSVIPFMIMYTVCNVGIMSVMLLDGKNVDAIENFLHNQGGTLTILLFSLFVYGICGGGASACGMINVLRKYVDDSHAWVWQDFLDGFKRNFVQGTIAFLLDCAAALILIINFGVYNFTEFAGGNGFVLTIMRGLLLLVILIWGMMHVYIYPTMTSFKFKLRDVYKNSFIMVLGKLPRTAAAFFLGAAVFFAVMLLSAVFLYGALLVPIILFAFCEYARLFIVYPLMKKYMRDPEEAKRAARLEAMRRDIQSDAGVFSDDRADKK